MLLTSALVLIASAAATPCIDYGSGSVEGKLVAEKMMASGLKEPGWGFFVELKEPICLNTGSHPNGYEPALQGVTKIQLIHPDKTGFDQTSALKGQSVSCLGTLFGRWTENHHTPVLMQGTCVGLQQGALMDGRRPVGSARP